MDELLRKFVFESVLKAVAARAVAAFPFLGLPIINPIFMYFLTKVAKTFYNELSLSVGFYSIQLATEKEVVEYRNAVDLLNKAKESGKDLKDANEKFKKAASDLIKFKH